MEKYIYILTRIINGDVISKYESNVFWGSVRIVTFTGMKKGRYQKVDML